VTLLIGRKSEPMEIVAGVKKKSKREEVDMESGMD